MSSWQKIDHLLHDDLMFDHVQSNREDRAGIAKLITMLQDEKMLITRDQRGDRADSQIDHNAPG